MVDVVQEQVEGLDALQQPGFERLPLGRRDRPRDQVEREDLLDAAAVGIDGEGDALVDEHEVGTGAALLKFGRSQLPKAIHHELRVVVRAIQLAE